MISTLSFPVICSPLSTKIEVDQYPHLQGLQLADSFDSNESIDVLIGFDHYWDFVEDDIVQGEFGPVAIDSKFGWLLSGSTNNGLYNETCTTNLVIGSSDSQLETTQDPSTSQARVFTYARCCNKDPGSGWSRDTPKSGVFLISDLYFIGEGW